MGHRVLEGKEKAGISSFNPVCSGWLHKTKAICYLLHHHQTEARANGLCANQSQQGHQQLQGSYLRFRQQVWFSNPPHLRLRHL